MAALYGVDFFVGPADQGQLQAALRRVKPPIRHLFVGNEDFDRYLQVLAEENLVVAQPLGPNGDLQWKLDIELTEPVPSEQIAIHLSRSSLLVARPKDENAQYSPYLVYLDGKFAYEAELEYENDAFRLRRT